jgi:hypothetical protein
MHDAKYLTSIRRSGERRLPKRMAISCGCKSVVCRDVESLPYSFLLIASNSLHSASADCGHFEKGPNVLAVFAIQLFAAMITAVSQRMFSIMEVTAGITEFSPY